MGTVEGGDAGISAISRRISRLRVVDIDAKLRKRGYELVCVECTVAVRITAGGGLCSALLGRPRGGGWYLSMRMSETRDETYVG